MWQHNNHQHFGDWGFRHDAPSSSTTSLPDKVVWNGWFTWGLKVWQLQRSNRIVYFMRKIIECPISFVNVWNPTKKTHFGPVFFFPSARYRNPLRGCCWLGPMQPSNSQIMELRLRQVLLQSKHMEGWNLLKPHESSRVFNSFVFFFGGLLWLWNAIDNTLKMD